MSTELTIAIFAGLGGMLGWGLADFFAKLTIDEVGAVVSLVWAHVFGTAVLILVALTQILVFREDLALPSGLGSWGLLVFFGALQALVYLLAYEGFGKGQIAVLNPVFASYSGLAALISIVVFGEVVSAPILVALAIIFGGVLFTSIDVSGLLLHKSSIIRTPGVKEVGLASLCAATWTVLWARFLGDNDWLMYALFMYLFMTIAVFLIAKVQRIGLTVTKPALWKFLALIGICETVAYLSISLGYSRTPYTSVVAVLSGAFSLPTIVLARTFLKEHVVAIQTAGSLLIVLGIVVLSLREVVA